MSAIIYNEIHLRVIGYFSLEIGTLIHRIFSNTLYSSNHQKKSNNV